MLSLITFDEFCENPEGILANPDLVVKVGNHYYTWLVAAPVLLSMGAFGRSVVALGGKSLQIEIWNIFTSLIFKP